MLSPLYSVLPPVLERAFLGFCVVLSHRQLALTALLNEIAAIPEESVPDRIVLVLDGFHALDAPPIDHMLTFLLEHLPAQLHLVLVTREDPRLPLALLRARGQMTELRAAELRFRPDEAAAFLNRAMGLQLLPEEVAALERRTEGWIAGRQLAALALQGSVSARGPEGAAAFIDSFRGSIRFVLDYLTKTGQESPPASAVG
jgi:LuxR family maltose regulon positive regulatory protein